MPIQTSRLAALLTAGVLAATLSSAAAQSPEQFFKGKTVTFYVGLSRRTLEKMRTQGGGPGFRRHGRYIRYHIDDLDTWSKGESANTKTEALS